MAVGIQKLDQEISTRLAASPTGLAGCQLQGAANIIDTTVVSVSSLAELPPAVDNRGRMVYVQDISAYRYSDGEFWVNDFTSLPDTLFVLHTWGSAANGRLGDGSTTNRCSPAALAGRDWCAVGGWSALKTDGTMWTWGFNSVGELGDGTVVNRNTPGTTAGGGTNWCALGGSTMAIKSDGTLWTWGNNNAGQLGDNSVICRSSPVTTSGGGTNWCSGSTGSGAVSAAAAIKTDGTLWTWGNNGNGQLGTNTVVARSSPGTTSGGGTNWCSVRAGGAYTAAIRTDSTLWTWGFNGLGVLGSGTTAARSSPGTTAGGGTNWCALGATTLAIRNNGTLWTWGSNNFGGLGDGTATPRSSPGTTIGGGTNWCSGSGGAGLKTDGTLWTWGLNSNGLLGDGTIINRSSPVNIPGSRLWCQVCLTAGGTSFGIQVGSKGFE